MTDQDVINIINKITYKPDFKIRVGLDIHGGVRVWFSRLVPDATGIIKENIAITYNTLFYNNAKDEQEVLEKMYIHFLEFEKHELKEWFKYNNVCFKDPHPELSK